MRVRGKERGCEILEGLNECLKGWIGPEVRCRGCPGIGNPRSLGLMICGFRGVSPCRGGVRVGISRRDVR
jgi:hypothetical protein